MLRPIIGVFNFIKWVYYKNIFGAFGRGARVVGKIWLNNPKNIYIGINTQIGPYCRIETFANYGNIITNPKLLIGNRCSLQHGVHIYCSSLVEIQDGCLIASGCMITDENHGMDPEADFYAVQPLVVKPTILKKGVWLGENVSVLPGSVIGERSIIGANSVVRGNIPDYSVAVGNPARVVKRYNFETKAWVKV